LGFNKVHAKDHQSTILAARLKSLKTAFALEQRHNWLKPDLIDRLA